MSGTLDLTVDEDQSSSDDSCVYLMRFFLYSLKWRIMF